MNIVFSSSKLPTQGSIFVGIFEEGTFTAAAELLNEKTSGLIKKSLTCTHFSGKKGEFLSMIAPAGISLQRIVLFGLGKQEHLKALDAMEIGAHIIVEAKKIPDKNITIMLDLVESDHLKNPKLAALVGSGLLLRSYEFTKYKTQLKEKDKTHIKDVSIVTDSPKVATDLFAEEEKIAEGVFFARTLAIEPPNVLYPETFVKELKTLTKLGVKLEVLDTEYMEKMGMHALLGVGQGSTKPSYLAIMMWNGAEKDEAPIAFVGKGVTFDSGGISIKPSARMDEMKMDMCGAAAVSGLMHVLASRQAKVNVVGVVGLTENMPDGNAQRPGDIVKSMSGQTIEILNTDAEGRLVLADALWYTQDRFKPKAMIDLATLTNAIVVSLGSKFAGLFSNDEGLAHKIKQAGEETKEQVWQLPMDERYDRDIDSKIADVKNVGDNGASSITAAHFLQRFVNKTPWAHLDIAGTSWNHEKNIFSGCYPIPTGFGVRLLNTLVHKFYEKH
ncbi:MAG: leucyl aminopeptidase [Alphaproteobacteria bacterium]